MGSYSAVPALAEEATDLEAAITSSNTVHDKFQFESSLDLDLRTQGDETLRRYRVELFMFLPSSMGVTSENYPRDRFYADLTSYLRLKTPEATDHVRVENGMVQLPTTDRYLQMQLSSLARQRLTRRVVQEVKLFGCHVNSQLRDLAGM